MPERARARPARVQLTDGSGARRGRVAERARSTRKSAVRTISADSSSTSGIVIGSAVRPTRIDPPLRHRRGRQATLARERHDREHREERAVEQLARLARARDVGDQDRAGRRRLRPGGWHRPAPSARRSGTSARSRRRPGHRRIRPRERSRPARRAAIRRDRRGAAAAASRSIQSYATVVAALGDRDERRHRQAVRAQALAWRHRRTPPAIEATTASWIVPPKRSRTVRSSERGSVTVLNARCWPPELSSGLSSRPRRSAVSSTVEPAWCRTEVARWVGLRAIAAAESGAWKKRFARLPAPIAASWASDGAGRGSHRSASCDGRSANRAVTRSTPTPFSTSA